MEDNEKDFTDNFTPEEKARWEEMKNEPIKATILTEEVEQLKKRRTYLV